MSELVPLKPGDRIPDALVAVAEKRGIKSASVAAIGGVDHLVLAYFNHESRKYEEHRFDEFMEVTGLVGNITLKEGKPFLHVHGTFGRKDLTVVGGHLISATVFPLLEVAITPAAKEMLRRFDERLGLNVMASEP